jgi:hypothetical protein
LKAQDDCAELQSANTVGVADTADVMTRTQTLALGPDLLVWAGEYAEDLNQAHYLVHQVIIRLLAQDRTVDDLPAIEEALLVLRAVDSAKTPIAPLAA